MITWLAVKTFFKKSLAWCKKYWQILIGASIPIVIWVLTRKSDNLDEVLKRVREDHEKEVDIINKAHDVEIELREKALSDHQERLKTIEEEHNKAEVDLSNRKKKQIDRIIRDNKDSPEEITRRIADLTGLEVHVK
jgi:hypothetical protein